MSILASSFSTRSPNGFRYLLMRLGFLVNHVLTHSKCWQGGSRTHDGEHYLTRLTAWTFRPLKQPANFQRTICIPHGARTRYPRLKVLALIPFALRDILKNGIELALLSYSSPVAWQPFSSSLSDSIFVLLERLELS